jgi:dienelactone hydrolase
VLPLSLALLVATPLPARAQAVRPGTLVERVTSPSDSTQAYALYVPAAYDTAKSWPVLFLMDPRGRALTPMRAFEPAAEEHGYIVISSYNTVSDSTVAPNITAINAMIADVNRLFNVDQRRYYMVGFSGTARLAWDFADQLNGAVAGIFGAGASGMQAGTDTVTVMPGLAFFGTAGIYDYNYEEMRAFEASLEETSLPHRIRYFRGGHAWAPDTLASQSVAWFQIRAMKRGLLRIDSALVATQFARDSAGARTAEASGHAWDALIRWREMLDDYYGLHATTDVSTEIDRLADDGRVQKEMARHRTLSRQVAETRRRLSAFLAETRAAEKLPDVRHAVKELQIERMRKQAADTTDADAAASAERELEDVRAHLGAFYARQALAAGRKDLALLYLDVAEIAQPGSTLRSPVRAEASKS